MLLVGTHEYGGYSSTFHCDLLNTLLTAPASLLQHPAYSPAHESFFSVELVSLRGASTWCVSCKSFHHCFQQEPLGWLFPIDPTHLAEGMRYGLRLYWRHLMIHFKWIHLYFSWYVAITFSTFVCACACVRYTSISYLPLPLFLYAKLERFRLEQEF